MLKLVYDLISALTFRIRGGLKILGHKLPLCKWWFAVWFATLSCILKGWSLNFWLVMLIASRLATQMHGWGEFCACVLGVGKPNPERKDLPEVDDFLDNLRWEDHFVKIWKWNVHIPAFNLLNHPILFGWLGLSARGLYMTFLIGLALNSIPFMVSGLAMGTIYWICGLIARKIFKVMDKTGWNAGEWCYGYYLGLCLTFFA